MPKDKAPQPRQAEPEAQPVVDPGTTTLERRQRRVIVVRESVQRIADSLKKS
jgi:hypothetical protein